MLDIGLPSLNGIEAARRIRKVSPESKILFVSQESSADVVQGDLILMDFSMPQMDGVQAARKIAESGTDIPILLFTLNLSTQIMEMARNARVAERDFKVGNRQTAVSKSLFPAMLLALGRLPDRKFRHSVPMGYRRDFVPGHRAKS